MYNHDIKPIDSKDIFYYRERNRNKVYAAIVSLFSKLVETKNLTKREIAFRLGKEPAQITRWLSGPSNWTLDTVSDLLLAMGGELEHKISMLDDKPALSNTHPLMRENDEPKVILFRQIDSKYRNGKQPLVSSGTNATLLMANLR